MKIDYNKIVECGNVLYYELHHTSINSIPCWFYEKLEELYCDWNLCDSGETFYDFCKKRFEKNKCTIEYF